MKKLLIVLLMLLTLVGCSSKNKEVSDNSASETTQQETKNEEQDIQSDIALTSEELEYQANISTIQVFSELSYDDAYRLINDETLGLTGLVYIGRSTCSYCQRAVKIYKETALANDFTIYYLDSTKARESENFEEYGHFAFFVDENGEELTEVPTIYAYKEGKVIDHYTGVADDYNDSSKDVSSEQYLFLYNKLVEMNNEISGLD